MTQFFSLPEQLLENSRISPDAPAIVSEGRRVSYGELAELIDAAGRSLEQPGLGSGRIAVRADKTPATIALAAACLLVGRPFLLPSTALGPRALAELLDRAGCSTLLAAEPADGGTGLTISSVDLDRESAPGAPSHRAPAPDAGEALLLTTSGSTGLPKIVPLTAAAIDQFTDWAATQFAIARGTRVLNYAPLSFDLCLLDIWASLRAGATVVLVDRDRATDGKYLAELVRTERVQVVQSVPMFFRLLADATTGPGAGPGTENTFTDIEQLIVTGDKIPAQLLDQLPLLFPNARMYNVYGSTETNDSFVYEIEGALEGAAVPIGRPIPGVDALVVDADGVVLDGPTEGELLTRTPFQTAGYLDPAASVGKFVDSTDGRGPYFRTGDLVRRDDRGVFTLLGRNDFEVKVRGTRVNLAEVEHVLLGHSAVLEAAVVGLPDETAGTRIHAVVRRSAPGAPDSLTLRERCRLQLPRAAIPTTFSLVDAPLPLTSTGKVDRQTLIRTVLDRK